MPLRPLHSKPFTRKLNDCYMAVVGLLAYPPFVFPSHGANGATVDVV